MILTQTSISFHQTPQLTFNILFPLRRETSRLPRLRQTLQLHLKPEDPHAPPLGVQAVQVRTVRRAIHPACPPQAPQAAALERAPLHVQGLRQVVHQRLWTQDPLEDDGVQALAGGDGDHGGEVAVHDGVGRGARGGGRGSGGGGGGARRR